MAEYKTIRWLSSVQVEQLLAIRSCIGRSDSQRDCFASCITHANCTTPSPPPTVFPPPPTVSSLRSILHDEIHFPSVRSVHLSEICFRSQIS